MNITKHNSSKLIIITLSLLLCLALAGCGKGRGGPSEAEIEKYYQNLANLSEDSLTDDRGRRALQGLRDVKISILERGKPLESLYELGGREIPKGTVLYPVIFTMATSEDSHTTGDAGAIAFPHELYFYQDRHGDWQADEPRAFGPSYSYSARYERYIAEYQKKVAAMRAAEEAEGNSYASAAPEIAFAAPAIPMPKPVENKIKGAFGVSLGDVLDDSSKIKMLPAEVQKSLTRIFGRQEYDDEFAPGDEVAFPSDRTAFPQIGRFLNFTSVNATVFFNPDNPVPPFQYYTISFTPKSRKIYAIQAVAVDEGARKRHAKSEKLTIDAAGIIKALREKYNAPEAFDRNHEEEYRDQNRVIYIGGREKFYLGIGYYDTNLMELANRETEVLKEEKRIEEERQKEAQREQERGRINAGGL